MQCMNTEKRSVQGLSPETLEHLAKREMEKNQLETEEWSERLWRKGQRPGKCGIMKAKRRREEYISNKSDQLC